MAAGAAPSKTCLTLSAYLLKGEAKERPIELRPRYHPRYLPAEAIKKLAKMATDGKEVPENLIMQKKSGTINTIKKKDGLYVYPLWIKKKINKGTKGAGLSAHLDEMCKTCDGDESWLPFTGQAM